MHDLEKILRPKSIVLIGVSRKEGSLGKKFLDALLRMNFNGEIFIINPKAICYCQFKIASLSDEVRTLLFCKRLRLARPFHGKLNHKCDIYYPLIIVNNYEC